jgi:hypothetical protein
MSDLKKVLLYKEEFIKHGFRRVIVQGQDRPQCVVCKIVLANSSLKTFNLKRHKEEKHKDLLDADESYFRKLLMEGEITNFDDAEAVKKASYQISYEIAKDGRPHTLGETTIKNSIVKFCETCADSRTLNLARKIPLSHSTVKKRIVAISENLENFIISSVQKASCFLIQCDESTDISDEAQLAVFVKFFEEDNIFEEILFCKPIGTSTTGQNIFS